jgi:ParB/RepB/Spo0J family partition protein
MRNERRILMAKDFGKSPIAKRFNEVAKTTMANIDVTAIKLIENSALIDYPHNGEDISYTSDLENSINELGFTDPIEVTDYGMSDGQYMIVSGHRRRAAGVKCGMTLFPCIIKSFENDESVQNYILLSNSQRDSEKDPLLFCRRYKLHEQHLKSINFQGSVREEVAKRLGVSVQQADRYNQMNKVISPIWELIRSDTIGMSSVLPMATLNQEQQQAIFEILKEFIADGTELTREKVKLIIDDYKKSNVLVFSHGGDLDKRETEEEEKEDSDLIAEDNKKLDKKKNTIKYLKKLNKKLETSYYYRHAKKARILLEELSNTLDIILDKSYDIGKNCGLEHEVQAMFENFTNKLKSEINNRKL